MAAKLIVLERLPGKRLGFRVAFWADVPTARQPFYAKAGAVSVYKNATTQENDAIASGAVAELVEDISVDPQGTTNQTITKLKDAAADRLAAFQAEVTAYNPWSNYGTKFDGSTWDNQGVA